MLAGVVAAQIPRRRLSPYQTKGGVNREAGFFGRQELLVDILSGGLARSLGLPRAAGLDAVLERLRASERRTLFLIDEADALVGGRPPGEAEDDVFARLRSLSEEGRCHFVLAGFWRLYEAAVLDYRSPLLNFGEPLRVGALEQDACALLATVPMASMGLSWEAGAVDELVRRTGRRANLIAVPTQGSRPGLSHAALRAPDAREPPGAPGPAA